MGKYQPTQLALPRSSKPPKVRRLLRNLEPLYTTSLGASYVGDSQDLLKKLPNESVDLVVTSPPYALHFKKEYGNEEKEKYVDWFRPFANEVLRILKQDGSFVLNIGGSYNAGRPTRSLYHFRLLLMLCEDLGFHLAQECFWFNPAKLPAPAEWVTVRRIRIKDSVEYVWWLSKTEQPRANNKKVLVPYSEDMKRLMKRGYKAKKRPSGHIITKKFGTDHGGAIPSNLINCGNNESNSSYIRKCGGLGIKPHPARFPASLPEFFIKLTTDPDDVVLDIFAGSNTTGCVAEHLGRQWLAFENVQEYLAASALRFDLDLPE